MSLVDVPDVAQTAVEGAAGGIGLKGGSTAGGIAQVVVVVAVVQHAHVPCALNVEAAGTGAPKVHAGMDAAAMYQAEPWPSTEALVKELWVW